MLDNTATPLLIGTAPEAVSDDKTIIMITGSEADTYWENNWTPKTPKPGLYPLNSGARMDRKTVYGPANNWLVYDVITTPITARYHLAQSQGVIGVMLEEAAKMEVLLICAETGHGDVVRQSALFRGEDATAKFGEFVANNPGALLINFNGFRFDNTVLKAHGVDLKTRSAVDLFLEIFRCVLPLQAAGVLHERSGWGLTHIDSTLFGAPKSPDPPFGRIVQLLQSQRAEENLEGVVLASQGMHRCKKLWLHVKSHLPVRSNSAWNVEIELWH